MGFLRRLFSLTRSKTAGPSDSEESRRALVRDRAGEACVFREKWLVVLCELSSVDTSDWGVVLRLIDLSRPGFVKRGTRSFSVSAAWEVFSHSRDEWSGYAGWVVYFDPELIASLEAIAGGLSDREPAEASKILRTHIDEHEMRRMTRRRS